MDLPIGRFVGEWVTGNGNGRDEPKVFGYVVAKMDRDSDGRRFLNSEELELRGSRSGDWNEKF